MDKKPTWIIEIRVDTGKPLPTWVPIANTEHGLGTWEDDDGTIASTFPTRGAAQKALDTLRRNRLLGRMPNVRDTSRIRIREVDA